MLIQTNEPVLCSRFLTVCAGYWISVPMILSLMVFLPEHRASADDSVLRSVSVTTQPAKTGALKSASSPCASVERATKAATGAAGKARAHIAAAKCALVLECAAPLSAELVGTGGSGVRMEGMVDRGLNHLVEATKALQRLPDDFDLEERQTLEDRIEMLRAFAAMFAVLAEADGSEEAKKRLTDACINLAIYVDDANPGVVDSAKLWQGAAYRRAGRPDRALQLLLPVLGTSPEGPVAFLARIERCRALADRGQYVSALSLSMKLDARIESWFEQEPKETRKKAADTIRWIRVDIHRRWAAALRAKGNEVRAKAAERRAREILGKDAFPPPSDRWLNLNETIAGLRDWDLITSRDLSK